MKKISACVDIRLEILESDEDMRRVNYQFTELISKELIKIDDYIHTFEPDVNMIYDKQRFYKYVYVLNIYDYENLKKYVNNIKQLNENSLIDLSLIEIEKLLKIDGV